MQQIANSLVSLLREATFDADRDRKLPDRVAEAFRREGLWKLWVPEEYGGAETPLPSSLELFEETSRIDGSIGWALTIGVGGGLFAAYLPDATAHQIFAPPEALIAGSGAPGGVRRPVSGGFEVSGEWRYASNIHHATWVTANTLTEDEKSEASILAVAVPATEVIVRDSWHTWAMRGTDSHDVAMSKVFVPIERTFSLALAPRVERPLYLFPFMGIAVASFAAVAFGVAQGGLDAFPGMMANRSVNGGMAASDSRLQARYAQAEANVRSARAWFLECAEAAWATVTNEGVLSQRKLEQLTLAAVHGTRSCAGAIERLVEVAGMRILYEDDALGRCWRDLQAIRQHALVSVMREPELGRLLLTADRA